MSYWNDREKSRQLKLREKEAKINEKEAKTAIRKKNGGAGFSMTFYRKKR